MVHPSRRHARFAAATVAALTFTLAGCASEDPSTNQSQEQPTETPGPSDEASASDSPTASDSASPSESPPAEETAATSGAPDSVTGPTSDGPLLTAEEVPGFNQEFTWTTAGNRNREGRKPFGTCQKFAMTSIGATDVRVRKYEPALQDPTSTAANLVADFPDVKTAKRAYEVLRSWRDQCAEELSRHNRQEVGQLRSVALPGAPEAVAHWYLLTYGPPRSEPDAGYFDAQGLVRVGSRISVLQMRTVGQDYNYRPGREPMVAAVRASAERLASG